jgi:hypothetical protein
MDNFDVWTQIAGYCDFFTIFNLKLVSSNFNLLKSHINWKEQYFHFFKIEELTEVDSSWETKFQRVFLKAKRNFNETLKEYQSIENRFILHFESLVDLLTQIQKEKILKEKDFQKCFSIKDGIINEI